MTTHPITVHGYYLQTLDQLKQLIGKPILFRHPQNPRGHQDFLCGMVLHAPNSSNPIRIAYIDADGTIQTEGVIDNQIELGGIEIIASLAKVQQSTDPELHEFAQLLDRQRNYARPYSDPEIMRLSYLRSKYPDFEQQYYQKTHSKAGDLLQFTGSWVGDDLHKCLASVVENRTKTELLNTGRTFSVDASLYFKVNADIDLTQVGLDCFNPHNPNISFRNEQLQSYADAMGTEVYLDVTWAFNVESLDEAITFASKHLSKVIPIPQGFTLTEVIIDDEIYNHRIGDWQPVDFNAKIEVDPPEVKTVLATGLDRSISWLEANTDDDSALVPALIQAYIALAQHHGSDPLTIRHQRTGFERMPQITDGIGSHLESEWDWSNRLARQVLQQSPPSTVTIRLIEADSFTLEIATAQTQIASCNLDSLERHEAEAVLDMVKQCWSYHQFDVL